MTDDRSDLEVPDAQQDAAAATEPELPRALEALLFLADEPLDVASLAEATEADPAAVEQELEILARRSVEERWGTEIRSVAGGWRMYTAPAVHAVVERWALAGRTGRLTQAALETLAVIAYKQPIGRQEIGEIRGVNADGAVRSLVARGFVAEVGRDPGPGQATLFGTTRLLLERLGLSSLEDLPPLTDFLPEAPAPDEPELGALKEIRRRLAAGGQLPGSGGGSPSGRAPLPTSRSVEEDEDVLPPPSATTRQADGEMDVLTDQLERAARNAVGRLRAAIAAGEEPPVGEGADPPQEGTADVTVDPTVADAAIGQPSEHHAPSATDEDRDHG